jgi:hypothetical protein
VLFIKALVDYPAEKKKPQTSSKLLKRPQSRSGKERSPIRGFWRRVNNPKIVW